MVRARSWEECLLLTEPMQGFSIALYLLYHAPKKVLNPRTYVQEKLRDQVTPSSPALSNHTISMPVTLRLPTRLFGYFSEPPSKEPPFPLQHTYRRLASTLSQSGSPPTASQDAPTPLPATTSRNASRTCA